MKKDLPENNVETWKKKDVIIKPGKVVVKLRYENGEFMKSIIMPTMMYPTGTDIAVFSSENTEHCTDGNVLDIYDAVQYEMGRCYTNTERLAAALLEAGYQPETYVGWLFITNNVIPVHHCWAVLGSWLLDLSGDMSVLMKKAEAQGTAGKDCRTVMADVVIKHDKLRNSERVISVGKADPNVLYVGSKASPEEGREIWRELIRQYPDHEANRANSKGRSFTQERVIQMKKER